MSAPFVPALDTFAGGQMTDLPAFTGAALDGTELIELVSGAPQSPTTANNANNYSITTMLLSQLLNTLRSGQVVIQQGQYNTALTAYPVPTTVSRIYVYKPTPEPTYITFGSANVQLADVLVQDVAGTLDNIGDGVFLNVSGSGITNPTLTSPWQGVFVRPVTSLNIWTLGAA